jgi:pyridoxal phosphate enzyme (YggS family)
VTLIAVSKTKPVEMMAELVNAGHSIFGENYVQEAAAKRSELGEGVELHLIGHLQRNKAKQAVQIFDLIQSVDSLRLAEEISKEAVKIGKRMPVLIQVNISAEGSKSGIDTVQTVELCSALSKLDGLELRGLMSIGSYIPESAADSERRREFKLMSQLLAEVNQSLGSNLRELSMGMSHDYTLAIEEGATIVRVGSQIFGARD